MVDSVSIENLLQTINKLDYERLDKISIKVSYLVQLRNYIKILEVQNEIFRKQNNRLSREVERLTGKVLENNTEPEFDRYI